MKSSHLKFKFSYLTFHHTPISGLLSIFISTFISSLSKVIIASIHSLLNTTTHWIFFAPFRFIRERKREAIIAVFHKMLNDQMEKGRLKLKIDVIIVVYELYLYEHVEVVMKRESMPLL
jgi:uncharacterized membrane protein